MWKILIYYLFFWVGPGKFGNGTLSKHQSPNIYQDGCFLPWSQWSSNQHSWSWWEELVPQFMSHHRCFVLPSITSIVRRNRPLSTTKCFTSKSLQTVSIYRMSIINLFFERENFSALQIFPWQSSDFSFPNRMTLFPKTSEHRDMFEIKFSFLILM